MERAGCHGPVRLLMREAGSRERRAALRLGVMAGAGASATEVRPPGKDGRRGRGAPRGSAWCGARRGPVQWRGELDENARRQAEGGEGNED